jgi:hypothetical protein
MLARQPTARLLMFGGLLVMAALLAIPLSSRLRLHAPLHAPSSPRVSANETQWPPPLRLVPGGLLLTPPEIPSASTDVPLTAPWPPALMLVSPDTAHSLGRIRGGSFAKADVPASAPTSEPEIGGLRKAPSLGPSQGLHPLALTQNTPTVPSKPGSASSRPVPPSVQAPLPTLPVLANTLEDDATRMHQDRGKLEQLPVGMTISATGAAAVGWFGISLTRRQKQRRATRRKSKREAVSLKGATPLIPALRSRPPQSHRVDQ